MNPKLTQEAWDAELLNYRNRSHVPRDLTNEDAQRQSASMVTAALISLVKTYANHVRAKAELGPIPIIRIPAAISEWISSGVREIDAMSGNLGSDTYKSLANQLLAELRDYEEHFKKQ